MKEEYWHFVITASCFLRFIEFLLRDGELSYASMVPFGENLFEMHTHMILTICTKLSIPELYVSHCSNERCLAVLVAKETVVVAGSD